MHAPPSTAPILRYDGRSLGDRVIVWLMACGPSEPLPVVCPQEHAVVSTLRFGRIEGGVSPGFDLDGVVSGSGDGSGCDKADLVDPSGVAGIDNAFGALLPVLEATEAAALEPLVQDFINNGTILLVTELSGFDPDAPGECGAFRVLPGAGAPLVGTDGRLLSGQTLDLDPGPYADAVPAEVDATEAFVAHDFGFDLDIQIFDAAVHLPVQGATVRMTRQDPDHFTATLGGGFLVDAILDSLLGTGIDAALQDALPGILGAAADLDLDADGSCESVSVSLEVDAVSVWVYE